MISILLATSFFVDVVVRGRVYHVFAGVEVPESRRPVPYRDIPFAAQPRTNKYLGGAARIVPGEPIRLEVFGTSRTFFGRLQRIRRPKGE